MPAVRIQLSRTHRAVRASTRTGGKGNSLPKVWQTAPPVPSFVSRRQELSLKRKACAGETVLHASAAEIAALDDDSSNVEFPEPLTPSERIKRAATFWGNVVPIFLSYKLFEMRIGSDNKGNEDAWLEQHEWGAERLENIINELKGFYVKSGQMMSTRPDSFAEPYIRRLSSLQWIVLAKEAPLGKGETGHSRQVAPLASAPWEGGAQRVAAAVTSRLTRGGAAWRQDMLDPMPIELVKAVVKQELLAGAPLSEVFEWIDPEPLGAASVAQ
ncbi:hypothetical protein CYMTET_21149, partial [Cymbomonas tetramitiformis]